MKTITLIAVILTFLGLTYMAFGQCPDPPVYNGGAHPSSIMAVYANDVTLPLGRSVYVETSDGVVCDVSPVLQMRSGAVGPVLHIAPDDPKTEAKDGAVIGDELLFRAEWIPNCGYLPILGHVVYTPQVLDWQFVIAKPGDLDRDGVIDRLDFFKLVEYAYGGMSGTDPTVHYDLNGDCEVTQTDVAIMAAVVYRGGDASVLQYGCR